MPSTPQPSGLPQGLGAPPDPSAEASSPSPEASVGSAKDSGPDSETFSPPSEASSPPAEASSPQNEAAEPSPGGPGPGRTRQGAIYVEGASGARPLVPPDFRALEKAAARSLPRKAFAYLAGGAGIEATMRANRAAFRRRALVPRMLRDVGTRDLGTDLFGQRLAAPLFLAPIGVLELAHREADLGACRAAAAENVPAVFSSQASVQMEACAEAMEKVRPGAPRFFQLYWSTDDSLVRSFVRRAEASGCSAVVLTLDTTMLGWRHRDLGLGYLPFLEGKGIAQYTSDPVFMARLDWPLPGPTSTPRITPSAVRTALRQARALPGDTWGALRSGRARKAVQRFVATYARPTLQWDDLARLRDMTPLPIVLKGLLHPEDAALAVEAGADGVYVSNHGGRQVDGAIGALDALPGIAEAVGGRVPVLFDSGIRTGADVVQALALGASAVGLGRPYAYGLALGGEAGARAVVQNLVADLDLTLGLIGETGVRGLGPHVFG